MAVAGLFNLNFDAGAAVITLDGNVSIADLIIADAASVDINGDLDLIDFVTSNGENYTVSMTGASNVFAANIDYLNHWHAHPG